MSLGIVRRLAKLLNASREVGRDLRIAITPVAPDPTARREADISLGVRRPPARLLLVGCNPAVLSISRLWLRSADYQVTTVLSMANALRQAASDPRIDLLVTDYDLDRGTGTQVIVALRQSLAQPLKAVLITGNAATAIAELPKDTLMRVASKPMNGKQLLSLVGELLDHSASR